MSLPFRKSLIAAALLGATALTACADPTSYRPATGSGFYRSGYSDQRIEPDRFQVSFAGNSVTSRERVEKYLLFRAAELTVQNGFDHFVLVDRDTDRQTRTYVDRGFGGAGFGGGGFGGAGFGGFGGYGYWGPGFGYWGPSWRYGRRGFGWGGWAGYGYDPFFDDWSVRQVDRYEAVAEIITGRGPKPASNTRAFDARAVIDTLGPQIEYPANRRR